MLHAFVYLRPTCCYWIPVIVNYCKHTFYCLRWNGMVSINPHYISLSIVLHIWSGASKVQMLTVFSGVSVTFISIVGFLFEVFLILLLFCLVTTEECSILSAVNLVVSTYVNLNLTYVDVFMFNCII